LLLIAETVRILDELDGTKRGWTPLEMHAMGSHVRGRSSKMQVRWC